MRSDTNRDPAAGHTLSTADRWAEVDRHFDAILEHLEALREDVPSWAVHAHFEQCQRVERCRSKLRTFKTVAGQ